MRIRPLSQFIKEGKEEDESASAVYLASELDLIDKAEKNVKSADADKDVQAIEKKRQELKDKYKEITGHEDTKKSIPEAKMQEAVSIYEGLLEDLDIKSFKEFGRKYANQIKKLVADIGGSYVGYSYDTPTKTIAIVTDRGVGKYYYSPEDSEFDEYQVQTFYK